jgi:hypothetical protein
VNEPEAIVFVVDDDPSFRRSVERLLRMAGDFALIAVGTSIAGCPYRDTVFERR